MWKWICAALIALIVSNNTQAQADPEIEFGRARFPSGAEIIVAPKSPVGLIEKLEQQMRTQLKQMPKDIFKEARKQRARGVWDIPIRVPDGTSRDALPALCDEYISFYLIPRVRMMAKYINKIQLAVKNELGDDVGHCLYHRDEWKITSDATGQPVVPEVKARLMNLGILGMAWIVHTMDIARFDMEKPVREYLLRVPGENLKENGAYAYVEAAARAFYAKDGDKWNLAFVVVEGTGENSFKPTGHRRIAVRSEDGEIMQFMEMKVTTGRVVVAKGEDPTNKVSRDDFLFWITVDNPILAERLNANPRFDYSENGIYKDSLKYLRVAGTYAARKWDANKVAVVSTAQIKASGNIRAYRTTRTAMFKWEDGEWVPERPKR